VHTWIRRYEQGGLTALEDRSHQPFGCPHQMSSAVEAELSGPIATAPEKPEGNAQSRGDRGRHNEKVELAACSGHIGRAGSTGTAGPTSSATVRGSCPAKVAAGSTAGVGVGAAEGADREHRRKSGINRW
jgi:hypothetical protein